MKELASLSSEESEPDSSRGEPMTLASLSSEKSEPASSRGEVCVALASDDTLVADHVPLSAVESCHLVEKSAICRTCRIWPKS